LTKLNTLDDATAWQSIAEFCFALLFNIKCVDYELLLLFKRRAVLGCPRISIQLEALAAVLWQRLIRGAVVGGLLNFLLRLLLRVH